MFTLVTLSPFAHPPAAFFTELFETVLDAVSSDVLSDKQSLALCEYLDCVKAQVPEISKAHAVHATSRLSRFLSREASLERARQLTKMSPSAAAMARNALGVDFEMKSIRQVA